VIQSTLINIRRTTGVYTEENITKTIILILIKMEVVLKSTFFIRDNASNNNICWGAIYRKLYLNIKAPNSRRVRYLNYISNLTIKVFLFKKNTDVFEKNINQKRNNAYIKKLRKLWRKKGPIRKFYNTVLRIRVTL
jgi:hypothetical protein